MKSHLTFTNGIFCVLSLVSGAMLVALSPVFLHAQGISSIWVNEGGDKVTQDELRVGKPNERAVINHVWDGSKVTIRGAKNEVVNFNIVIEAATLQATGVHVSFTMLTGPDGAVIQSAPATGDGVFNWVGRPIELFYVRYLQIKGLSQLGYEDYDERHVPERLRRPWTGQGLGNGTWQNRPDHDKYYPDIAVPLELVPSFTIAAQKNQSIWVDIYLPKTVPAGMYAGAVAITESGGTARTLPVELIVHDFTLPDLPTCKTMLVIGGGDSNARYFGVDNAWVQGANEPLAKLIQDRHFLLAHRHKISLIGDDSWINGDYTTEDHPAGNFAARLKGSFFTGANGYDGPGVGVGNNVYSIHTYGIPESWKSDTAMRRHSDAWVNWFEANAPETEYFVYLIDESHDFQQTETWCKWLDSNPGPGKRLKSMATAELPGAIDSIPSLKVVASTSTIGIPSQWEDAAARYSHDPSRRFFLYNGTRPAGGSFMTDDDGVALRVNAWIQFKKHINRWFYWESTYYDDFQGGSGRMDLFNSAHTFGSFSRTDSVIGETGYNYSNGDGVLFYPGTDMVFPASSYGVNGPFASLRMKQWRRGLQDHDYLVLASAIDSVAVQKIVTATIPKVVWEVGVSDPGDPTWVRTDISWSTNPDVWEAARDSLAKIILSGNSGGIITPSISQEHVSLYRNVPDPFRSHTIISYVMGSPGQVCMKIIDMSGREIITLVNDEQAAGKHTVAWNGKNRAGRDIPAGVYFCRISDGNRLIFTEKMMMVK